MRLWKRCKLIFSLDPKVSYVLWIWCNFQAGSVLRNRYVSSILFIIMFLLLFWFVLFTSTSYFVDVNSFVASFSFKTFQRLSMLFKTLLKPGTRQAFAAITNCEISVFFVLRDFGTFCNGINSGEKRAQWPRTFDARARSFLEIIVYLYLQETEYYCNVKNISIYSFLFRDDVSWQFVPFCLFTSYLRWPKFAVCSTLNQETVTLAVEKITKNQIAVNAFCNRHVVYLIKHFMTDRFEKTRRHHSDNSCWHAMSAWHHRLQI